VNRFNGAIKTPYTLKTTTSTICFDYITMAKATQSFHGI